MKSPLAGLSQFDYFGVLLLRLGIGALVAFHGFPALVGGSEAWTEIGKGAAILHIPEIPFLLLSLGLASAILQTIGGLCLAIGLFTRGAALLLAIAASIALANIVAAHDFSLNFFAHLQVTLLLYALVFIGPGRLSFDRKGI